MKQLLTLAFLWSMIPVFGQTVVMSTDFQQGIPTNYTLVDNDGNTPDPLVAEYTSAWITVVDPENALDTVTGMYLIRCTMNGVTSTKRFTKI